MEKITLEEFQKRVDTAVEETLKGIDEQNEEYKKENPMSNSEPLVLGTCPQCNFDLSKYLIKRDLRKAYHDLLWKNVEIDFEQLPGTTNE